MNYKIPKILKEYWCSSLTVRQIASENETSLPELYKVLREYGVAMKNKKYYDQRRFEDLPQKSQDLIKTCYEEGEFEKEEIIKIFNVRKESIESVFTLKEKTQTSEITFITEDIESLKIKMKTMRVAMSNQEKEERLLKEKRSLLEENMGELKKRFEEICSDIGDYIHGNVR